MIRNIRERFLTSFFFSSIILTQLGCSCNMIEKVENARTAIKSPTDDDNKKSEKSDSGSSSEISGSRADSNSNDSDENSVAESTVTGSDKSPDQRQGKEGQSQGQGKSKQEQEARINGMGDQGVVSSKPATSRPQDGGAEGTGETKAGSGNNVDEGISGVSKGEQPSATGSVAGRVGEYSPNNPKTETYTKAGRMRKK